MSTLKLILKKDWDYFPHYEKQVGHFIGRAEEKERVKNWFLRREKGCFLVSGERGVGKTALVYEALHEAKEKKKEIVPVIINSLQLILGEKEDRAGGRDANSKQTLEEKIIINLIRRLYTALRDKLSGDLKESLQNLYRKAVASKSEVREEINLISEIEKEERTTSELRTRIKVTPESIKYFFSCLGIAIGMAMPLFPPFISNSYSLNILVGLLFSISPIALPLSIYSQIIHYTEEVQRHNAQKAFKELYVKDNSIGNLEYDLFDLLEKTEKRLKIIFIIDEMDKIDDKDQATVIPNLLKTFKNLFTLSSGLFVFVGGKELYNQVVEAKEQRQSSYTLFSDRIFVSRPNFVDLENYIATIVDMSLESFESNPVFKQFRNLLCYNAKSDFFELHFCIRDYIKGFDEKDRPILEVDLTENVDRLKANMQKAMGQIFEFNKYVAYSDWHFNEDLLRQLYIFLGDLSHEIEHTKIMGKKHDSFSRRLHEAKADLITYLLRLSYIKKSTERNAIVGDENLLCEVFSWTGQINDIPIAPKYLLDYESKFLEKLSKFAGFVNDIEDLKSNLAGEAATKRDRSIVYSNRAQELCDFNVLGVFEEMRNFKAKLSNKSNPEHILREELEKQTNRLGDYITQLQNGVTTIAEKLIKSVKFNNLQISKIETDSNLFGSTMLTLKEEIIKSKLQSIGFYWKNFPVYNRQVLIVRDLPNEVYEHNKNLINDHGKHFLILNLNMKETNYNLDYNDNAKNNYKIYGFVDFLLSKSFLPLLKVIEELRRVDRTPPTKEEKSEFLNRPTNDKTLREFTELRYPGLGVIENIHSRMMQDINLSKYPTLLDINNVIEKAKSFVNAYAKQSPDLFKYGTDYLTKSLGYVDEEFLQKHPFSQQTRDSIKRFKGSD